MNTLPKFKMKTKITLIIAAIFFTIVSVKAQIPNSNMENWAIANNGTDSLINWTTSNHILSVGPGQKASVEYEPLSSIPGPNQGNYAVKINSRPAGAIQNYSFVGLIVSGQAELVVPPNINLVEVPYVYKGGGTPISYKPTHLMGYYTFNSTDFIDKGVAYILLSKHNIVKQKRDTVGFATYFFLQNTAYTNFSIPIADVMPGVMPDTITTIFYSSDPNTVGAFVSSNLYVDALVLTPTTGVEENDVFSNINVYPNPNNGNFTIAINCENKNKEQLEIIDSEGKIIKHIILNPSDQEVKINMSEFSDGSYFLKSNSVKIYSKKIIVKNKVN